MGWTYRLIKATAKGQGSVDGSEFIWACEMAIFRQPATPGVSPCQRSQANGLLLATSGGWV